MRTSLEAHNIAMKPRLARRDNKLEVVERKNGVTKATIMKLEIEESSGSSELIIEKAKHLCNRFSWSRTLSSFELDRGYIPSTLGIPYKLVSKQLLVAHKGYLAVRALQKLLSSRNSDVPQPTMLNEGDRVWILFKTTAQNIKVERITARLVEALRHIRLVRRSSIS